MTRHGRGRWLKRCEIFLDQREGSFPTVLPGHEPLVSTSEPQRTALLGEAQDGVMHLFFNNPLMMKSNKSQLNPPFGNMFPLQL